MPVDVFERIAQRMAASAGTTARWLDTDGDEWWETPTGFRLAGRSPGGPMDGWTRDLVEEKFGPLRPYEES